LLFISSCNSDNNKIENDPNQTEELILGTWSMIIPEEVIERSYPDAYIVSMTCYKEDSTWESFHGDYSDKGIYWIEDNWLFKSPERYYYI